MKKQILILTACTSLYFSTALSMENHPVAQHKLAAKMEHETVESLLLTINSSDSDHRIDAAPKILDMPLTLDEAEKLLRTTYRGSDPYMPDMPPFLLIYPKPIIDPRHELITKYIQTKTIILGLQPILQEYIPIFSSTQKAPLTLLVIEYLDPNTINKCQEEEKIEDKH